jgi:hypothetical protein
MMFRVSFTVWLDRGVRKTQSMGIFLNGKGKVVLVLNYTPFHVDMGGRVEV